MVIELSPLYQGYLRKVRAWLNATSPYERAWCDEDVIAYALVRIAEQIESGKLSSLLKTEKLWIEYCVKMKRKDDEKYNGAYGSGVAPYE